MIAIVRVQLPPIYGAPQIDSTSPPADFSTGQFEIISLDQLPPSDGEDISEQEIQLAAAAEEVVAEDVSPHNPLHLTYQPSESDQGDIEVLELVQTMEETTVTSFDVTSPLNPVEEEEGSGITATDTTAPETKGPRLFTCGLSALELNTPIMETEIKTVPVGGKDLPTITPVKIQKLYDEDEEKEANGSTSGSSEGEEEIEIVRNVKTAPAGDDDDIVREDSSTSSKEGEQEGEEAKEEEVVEKKEVNMLPLFHLACTLVCVLTLLTVHCSLRTCVSLTSLLYFSLTTALEWECCPRNTLPDNISDILLKVYMYLVLPGCLATGFSDMVGGGCGGMLVLVVPVLCEGWILYKVQGEK
eukprot:sb/3466087/